MNTKQSVKGGVWHTGDRCRRTRGQKGGIFANSRPTWICCCSADS